MLKYTRIQEFTLILLKILWGPDSVPVCSFILHKEKNSSVRGTRQKSVPKWAAFEVGSCVLIITQLERIIGVSGEN